MFWQQIGIPVGAIHESPFLRMNDVQFWPTTSKIRVINPKTLQLATLQPA